MVKLPDATGLGQSRFQPSGRGARLDPSDITEGNVRAARAYRRGGEAISDSLGRAGGALSRAVATEAGLGRAVAAGGEAIGTVIERSGARAGTAVARAGAQMGTAVERAGAQLGAANQRGGTAIARAIERGGEYWADATRAAGRAQEQGLASLGKGLQDIAKAAIEVQLQHDRMDFARAKSAFLIDKAELDGRFANDQDYATMKPRYSDELGAISQRSAGMIANPAFRERFSLDTGPIAARGIAVIDQRAFKAEADTNIATSREQLEKLRQAALTSTEEDRGQHIVAGQSIINGLEGRGYIDASVAQRWRSQWAQDYAVAAIEAKPPEERINLLREAPGSRDSIVNRILGNERDPRNPAARSRTSSATGDGQFIESTWLQMVEKHRPDLLGGTPVANLDAASRKKILDLRADPNLSREMVGYLVDDNSKILRDNGIVPTPANLYLAHFLGAGAAVKTLKSPAGTSMADVVEPQAIQANRSILMGRTTESVVAWAEKKMGGSARGSGSLIDFIPEDRRVNLLNRATTEVLRRNQEEESATALEQYNVKELMTADLASMARTGAGVPDLTADRIRMTFGSQKAQEWERSREDAHAVWVNTHDLGSLPEDKIAERINALRPQEASPDFHRQQRIFTKVQEAADAVRTRRFNDPALSVNEDPGVVSSRSSYDPKKPETFQTVAAARMAAQERVGVPEEMRTPLTKDEALQLTEPMRRMLVGQERQVLTEIATSFKTMFGEHADAAFEYALHARRINAETSRQAARIMRRLAQNEPVTTQEARDADTASELGAAERAIGHDQWLDRGQMRRMIDPNADEMQTAGSIKPKKQIPASQDIQWLLRNPSAQRIQTYDAKFGNGAAQKILETYPMASQ